MDEKRVKIGTAYERLQTLDIMPTRKNMEILLQTLYDLKDVYNKMEEEEQNADRQKADPEGRDDH